MAKVPAAMASGHETKVTSLFDQAREMAELVAVKVEANHTEG